MSPPRGKQIFHVETFRASWGGACHPRVGEEALIRFDRPLDDVLRSRGHVRVLRALFAKGLHENLSARAIARRAGVSHPRVGAILADLSSQEIVVARRGFGYGLFELNEDHAAVRALWPLFEWETEIADELVAYLRRAVAARSEHVRAALLGGDLAWGEEIGGEVIEMAVLTAPDRQVAVWERFLSLRDRVRRRFGSDLELLVESRRRAAELARKGREPWRRIADYGVPLYRTFPR
jgi:DNA-binding transcriptional ArsR family regulator